MDAYRISDKGPDRPNAGHVACRAHTRASREFDMIGRIRADIFQERYMLNEVGIKLHLVRSKDIAETEMVP